MKVIALQFENLRKISAISMEFTNNGLIQIRGRNEQGKSTILDSLEILLRGKKFTPKDVIKHGESKARIISQIGDYKIERIIDKKGVHKIKLSGKDGKQVTSKPQDFLNKLVNDLTFDPKPFVNKTADQKLKFMMELLDMDFSSDDEKIKELSTERTLIGREVKSFGELPILAEVKEVDIQELLAKKEAIDDHNNHVIDAKSSLESCETQLTRFKREVKQLEDKITETKEIIEQWEGVRQSKISEIKSCGELESLEGINEMINNVSETNKKAVQYLENEKKKKELKIKEDEYSKLTEGIEVIRDQKERKLLNSEMPVKGLKISDEGVYYEDIHCDNWSDSQSMRISFELCVAMQPELKAVFIDRGESYDEDQLILLDKWAKENDIQAFITIVDSNIGEKDDAIYIQDGKLVV